MLLLLLLPLLLLLLFLLLLLLLLTALLCKQNETNRCCLRGRGGARLLHRLHASNGRKKQRQAVSIYHSLEGLGFRVRV